MSQKNANRSFHESRVVTFTHAYRIIVSRLNHLSKRLHHMEVDSEDENKTKETPFYLVLDLEGDIDLKFSPNTSTPTTISPHQNVLSSPGPKNSKEIYI